MNDGFSVSVIPDDIWPGDGDGNGDGGRSFGIE